MTPMHKVLGAATLIVLSLSALGASVAQAQFTASSYPATITGSSSLGNGELKTEGGTIECAEHFQGTFTESTTKIKLTPSFTNCKAFGFLAAVIDLNGCNLWLYSGGTIDVDCPAGKVIEVTASSCVIHVMSQSGLGSTSIWSSGSHILVLMSVSNLTYYVTKDGFGCAFNGTGHKTGMSWIHNTFLTFTRIGGGSVSKD